MSEAATKSCRGAGAKRKPRPTQAFVRLLKALGDETRLEMMAVLATAGGEELCACDIEAHFDLAQPTVSHHLKVLRDAALVEGERRGTWVYYRINGDTLRLLPELHALLTKP